MELTRGEILSETYELIELIGRGGMGSVWRAQHKRLPKEVAVKVLHRVADAGSVMYARFRREAEITSRLSHPHIVEVTDFNLHGDIPYIVMPLLVGRPLRHRMLEGQMPLAEVQKWTRQMASGLRAAHAQGVIHRDLKPGNVFLVRSEAGESIKVLDFGTSKILGSTSVQTAKAAVLGTPQYMAPEQAIGDNDNVGPHTDQFALAAVAYEMLCGQPPFGTGHPAAIVFRIVHEEPPALSTIRPDVPDTLCQAIHTALAKDVPDRHRSIDAFVTAFCGHALEPAVTDQSSDTLRELAEAPTEAAENADSVRGALATRAGVAPIEPVELVDTGAQSGGPVTPTAFSRRWLTFAIVGIAAAVVVALAAASWNPESASDPQRPRSEVEPSTAPLEPSAASRPSERPSRAPRDAMDSSAPVTVRVAARAPATTLSQTRRPPTSLPVPAVPKSPAQPGKKPPKPNASPEQLARAEADVKAAERAFASGKYQRAVHLARRSMRSAMMPRAAVVIAKSRCINGDLGGARAMLYRVGSYRGAVKRYCLTKGVEL